MAGGPLNASHPAQTKSRSLRRVHLAFGIIFFASVVLLLYIITETTKNTTLTPTTRTFVYVIFYLLLATTYTFHSLWMLRQEQQILKDYSERMERVLFQSIESLAMAVEARDPYTAGHQRRVANLACAIAVEMGLSEERVKGLHLAATVHDVGKMCIPAEMLTTTRKLRDEEWTLIKRHTNVGFEILKPVEFPWPVAQIVGQHHERFDGSGYDKGTSKDNVLLEARILAVADVAEAMASDRPYRPALGIEAAIQELQQNKGSLYDPQVVDAYLRIVEKGFKC